jgi:HPt (histidine-containing phosphotransfer) domain-containing protein
LASYFIIGRRSYDVAQEGGATVKARLDADVSERVSPLRALVIRHCASLGERVGALSALVSGLFDAADREGQIAESRALAHQIVGASGSIGFDELSAMAATLEVKLAELQAPCGTTSPALLEHVSILGGELERLAAATKPEHSRLYNADLESAATAVRGQEKAIAS